MMELTGAGRRRDRVHGGAHTDGGAGDAGGRASGTAGPLPATGHHAPRGQERLRPRSRH